MPSCQFKLMQNQQFFRREFFDLKNRRWLTISRAALKSLRHHQHRSNGAKTGGALAMSEKRSMPKASNFIVLDVMKVGGVTGWMRSAALAEANGIPASSHLWPEISAQLLSSTATSHRLEYANWWTDVIEEPLWIDAGMAVTADLPGTGVSWRDGALERFRA